MTWHHSRRLPLLALATATALGGGVAAGIHAASAAPQAPPSPAPVYELASPGGDYVVMLKNARSLAATTDSVALARAAGAHVTRTFPTLGGYAASIRPGAQLDAIRRDPNVLLVSENRTYTVDGRPSATTPPAAGTTSAGGTQRTAPWHLDRVDQRQRPLDTTYSWSYDGSGVRVYVLDTGIRRTHVEFEGRVEAGHETVGDGGGTNDCHGHGTGTSSLIAGKTYGVAKKATIVPVRSMDCAGRGVTAKVVAGVDWITQDNANRPSVLNMSIGGEKDPALDEALKRMWPTSNIALAVASGNWSNDACSASPARFGPAVTVGAIEKNEDKRASFSSYGSCVDMLAPGTFMQIAWKTNDTSMTQQEGTSLSAPMVAGAMALYRQQYPYANHEQVQQGILDNATPGIVTDLKGDGNLLLYTTFDKAPPTPTPTPTPTVTPTPTPTVTSTPTPSPTGECGTPANGTIVAGGRAEAATFTAAGAGQSVGCLTAGAGTDFDLYVQRLTDGRWRTVASSASDGSTEKITYAVQPGTYRYLVVAFAGSGDFTFSYTAP